MFSMFESATLKLTGWYLLIIMVISLLFSILVYQSASSELQTRLEQFGYEIPHDDSAAFNGWPNIQRAQLSQASHNLFIVLVYVNCLVLVAGGIASYLMAKRTLEPLEKVHEAESRFVSNASHELRTPLAAMKTELEAALRAPSLTKHDMRELLESNLEEVNKLTILSQSLLNLSRLNYTKLTHEPLSLTTIVTETIQRYHLPAQRIKVKKGSRPVMIDAHRSSIEELLTILVDNAQKYSPEHSTIYITLSVRNKKARFEITNQGAGISPEDLPHIFDRFYRADHSRTRSNSTGFGLGLSLAKTIVELHHGELSVTSGSNADTTFTVLLPIVKHGSNSQKSFS